MQKSNWIFPLELQRKRKRKDHIHLVDSSLNLTANDGDVSSTNVESKRKKTMSRVSSLASFVSTPVAKAFKKSVSSVKLSASPAPKSGSDLPTTPGKFFMRSASVAKVLQQHNSNTPESPLLKRSGLGRNSSTNLTPYK